MRRASISAGIAFLASAALLSGTAAAQNRTSKPPAPHAVRADEETSSSPVRIVPTAMPANSTSMEAGSDHWSARGYDIRTLIAEIFSVDERRVDISDPALAAARYDVSVSLPGEVEDGRMRSLLGDALERRFHVAIRPETRTEDVYVLSAPNGPGSALHPHNTAASPGSAEPPDGDAAQITFLGKDCDGVFSGGFKASAETLGDFQRTLEPGLDRLLVDETGLKGSYDFQIAAYRNQQELFQMLRDQLGLVVTPERREVSVLTVRPRNVLQAAM